MRPDLSTKGAACYPESGGGVKALPEGESLRFAFSQVHLACAARGMIGRCRYQSRRVGLDAVC